MKKLLSIALLVGLSISGFAQPYVLKDHRPDSNANLLVTYDSLPILIDTFFRSLSQEDLATMKDFVPDMKYLKYTFDTLNVDYNLQMVVSRQQMILRGLQKDYKKILKKAKKDKLKLKRLVVDTVDYEFGEQERYKYCYVTVHCVKKKKKYDMKFLTMELLGNWFIADEFYLEWIE